MPYYKESTGDEDGGANPRCFACKGVVANYEHMTSPAHLAKLNTLDACSPTDWPLKSELLEYLTDPASFRPLTSNMYSG